MEIGNVGASAGMGNVMARISGIQSQLALLSRTPSTPLTVPAAPPAAGGTSAGKAAGSGQFAAALQSAVATGTPATSATAATSKSADAVDGTWTLPVQGRVTSKFGMRTHPVTGVYK